MERYVLLFLKTCYYLPAYCAHLPHPRILPKTLNFFRIIHGPFFAGFTVSFLIWSLPMYVEQSIKSLLIPVNVCFVPAIPCFNVCLTTVNPIPIRVYLLSICTLPTFLTFLLAFVPIPLCFCLAAWCMQLSIFSFLLVQYHISSLLYPLFLSVPYKRTSFINLF